MSGEPFLPPEASNSLGRFLWNYYQTRGDPEKMRAQLAGAGPLETTLLQVYAQAGADGVRQAIALLKTAKPSSADGAVENLAAWLKERLNVH